mgnify:FL=1
MKVNRRDPLFVTGAIIALLFLLLVSVLGRMFVFLRVITTLLLLAVVLFAVIAGARVYFRGQSH